MAKPCGFTRQWCEPEEYAASRELVAKKMTPQQIAEAQRRAREWKSKSGAVESR